MLKPQQNEPWYKLYKLGNIPNSLNTAYEKHLKPRRELSVNEQIIGTKTRVSFIRYIPKKTEKVGITFWALCEAVSGYCLKFKIYNGKKNIHLKKGLG